MKTKNKKSRNKKYSPKKQTTQTIEILTGEALELMRISGLRTASCLSALDDIIKPGITTKEIDEFVFEFLKKIGNKPSTLSYKGFPASCCTSINEVVCHGIPGYNKLNDGDIVNVDIASYVSEKNAFHGDTSVTFLVGNVSEETKKLVKTTKICLDAGIKEVKAGAPIGNIGAAIQEIAEKERFSVVECFVGHGVGTQMHQPPIVPHYGKSGSGPKLIEGMIFTIEPMLNQGSKEVEILQDGWTAVTKDRKLSAQFEHTIRVTKEGCEILTQREKNLINTFN